MMSLFEIHKTEIVDIKFGSTILDLKFGLRCLSRDLLRVEAGIKKIMIFALN